MSDQPDLKQVKLPTEAQFAVVRTRALRALNNVRYAYDILICAPLAAEDGALTPVQVAKELARIVESLDDASDAVSTMSKLFAIEK
jgi:predicted secreted protein